MRDIAAQRWRQAFFANRFFEGITTRQDGFCHVLVRPGTCRCSWNVMIKTTSTHVIDFQLFS
ncbi:MAG: hypothetical protein ACYCZA_14910, partial [Thiobacillus sp.]